TRSGSATRWQQTPPRPCRGPSSAAAPADHRLPPAGPRFHQAARHAPVRSARRGAPGSGRETERMLDEDTGRTSSDAPSGDTGAADAPTTGSAAPKRRRPAKKTAEGAAPPAPDAGDAAAKPARRSRAKKTAAAADGADGAAEPARPTRTRTRKTTKASAGADAGDSGESAAAPTGVPSAVFQ